MIWMPEYGKILKIKDFVDLNLRTLPMYNNMILTMIFFKNDISNNKYYYVKQLVG